MDRGFVFVVLYCCFNCLEAKGLELTISPDDGFTPGLSPYLNLNCTLPNDLRAQAMAAVTSLIIDYSRYNDSTSFSELVSNTVYDGQPKFYPVKADVSNAPTALGIISNTNTSYLSVSFTAPTNESAGFYKCEAFGVDSVGRPVAMFSPTLEVITVQSSEPEVFSLVSTPKMFNPGDSQDLTLNCTLPTSVRKDASIHVLNSMIITHSRENGTNGFMDLVSRTRNHSHVLGTLGNFTRTHGHISNTDTSFVEVTFLQPNQNVSGWYKCEVFGVDVVGHPVVMTTTVIPVNITHDVTGQTDREERLGFQLRVNYDAVIPGLTRELKLNCTLPNTTLHKSMSTLTSLNLSYSFVNQSHGFSYMVSYTSAGLGPYGKSPNRVYGFSSYQGHVSSSATSYLTAHYYKPVQNVTTWYWCLAYGRDGQGQPVNLTTPTVKVDSVRPAEEQGMFLTVTPEVIQPGVTRELTLNCGMDDKNLSRAMEVVDMIMIFVKDKWNIDFKYLVSKTASDVDAKFHYFPTEFSAHNGQGQISTIGLSYLSVQLSIKQFDRFEVLCKASGKDSLGNNLVLISPVQTVNIKTT